MSDGSGLLPPGFDRMRRTVGLVLELNDERRRVFLSGLGQDSERQQCEQQQEVDAERKCKAREPAAQRCLVLHRGGPV